MTACLISINIPHFVLQRPVSFLGHITRVFDALLRLYPGQAVVSNWIVPIHWFELGTGWHIMAT